jgi:hypothetical protein
MLLLLLERLLGKVGLKGFLLLLQGLVMLLQNLLL